MKIYLKILSNIVGIFLLSYLLSFCGDTPVNSIGGDDEITDTLRYCKNSAQCDKDEECLNHRCIKKKERFCKNKDDCNPGEDCINSKCVSVADVISEDVTTDIYIPDGDYPDNAVIKAKIKAEPEQLDFGALRYKEKAEKSVVIKNTGDSGLKVMSIQIEQGENKDVFSFRTDYVNNTVLDPGESFEIIVSCVQDDAEPDTGYLLISSDDENMPLLRIKTFNSYKDVPDLKVVYLDSNNKEIFYPQSGDRNVIDLDIGNIPQGEKKSQIFRIVNNAEYGILLLKNISYDPMNLNDKNKNKFSSSLKDAISGDELNAPLYLSGGEYANLVIEYDAKNEAGDDRYSISIR
ncbi:MAG: hypothetical protein N3B13_12500, partial [Deltaproteobacteria bacterium]|nr:hypothetical protein [Deltaproteobacteria bacterium]